MGKAVLRHVTTLDTEDEADVATVERTADGRIRLTFHDADYTKQYTPDAARLLAQALLNAAEAKS